MKTKICYNLDELQKLITGHTLRRIDFKEESEDWGKDGSRYHFALPEIERIKVYDSVFSTHMHIILKNGDDVSAYSENLGSINGNTDLVRINKNKYISPALIVNGEWIEATDELREWLNVFYPAITDDILKNLSNEFIIYDTVEYPGVPTPIRHSSYWGYSSRDLVLDEREIESVLNSIEDELLRKKIECILYARVFKKR